MKERRGIKKNKVKIKVEQKENKLIVKGLKNSFK